MFAIEPALQLDCFLSDFIIPFYTIHTSASRGLEVRKKDTGYLLPLALLGGNRWESCLFECIYHVQHSIAHCNRIQPFSAQADLFILSILLAHYQDKTVATRMCLSNLGPE